jgi:aminocarboxymuconate-semialdehyde decarboxylase
MSGRKTRYGLTAARQHIAVGRVRRPDTTTIDIHCHIVVPAAAAHARPHVEASKIPLSAFADAASRAVNVVQNQDRAALMYADLDTRLRDMDRMGVDIQVVAPAPGQSYYTIPPDIAGAAHTMANEGVAAFIARDPSRFLGLGTVTLQEPARAADELEQAMRTYGLKGVQVLTNVDGEELADPRFRPFWAKAEALDALIVIHPNGFTGGERFTKYYFNNIIGNPLDTAVALHHLIFSGTLADFPDLKLLAVHGGGFLPGYSGRMDHAWGAREDSHAGLKLPPTHYLRNVYFDTVVFTHHQLANMIDLFGPDRIMMGTDYPFDMGEYDPIGHVAGTVGDDSDLLKALTGGNAIKALGLTL